MVRFSGFNVIAFLIGFNNRSIIMVSMSFSVEEDGKKQRLAMAV